MVEHVLYLAHGRAGHSLAEPLLPFESRSACERLTKLRYDLACCLGALPHGVVTRVRRHFRHPGQFAKRLPKMRRIGGNVDPSLLRRMNAGHAARAQIAVDITPLAGCPDEAARLHSQCRTQE